MPRPAQTADLPLSMIDVAEAVGLRVALKLMQNFGGMELSLPANPPETHPVVAALGATDGYALARYIGGGRMYVPHGRRRRSARAEVLSLEAAGMDRAAIARALGISQRHVRRVANRNADPDQDDLFSGRT